MALWQVYENSRGTLTMVHRSFLTGLTHKCGDMPADTTAGLIIDWVYSHGDPLPWDVVALPGGVVLQLLPAHTEPEVQPAPQQKPTFPDWRRRS